MNYILKWDHSFYSSLQIKTKVHAKSLGKDSTCNNGIKNKNIGHLLKAIIDGILITLQSRPFPRSNMALT